MRGLLARVIAWAMPVEFWCPCLQCLVARGDSTPHKRKVEISKRDEKEPWMPAGARLTEPNGAMYNRTKEH